MKPIKTPIKSSDPQRWRFAVDRRTLLMSLVGGATGIGGTAALMLRSAPAADESRKVMLYKNPSCECCEGYANYLRDNGFEVSVVPTHDLTLLTQKYAIPTGSEPCHISLVGGYFVGGPHSGRGGQSAARGKACDHWHQPARNAGGHTRHGGKEDRSVHNLRDRRRAIESLCLRLAAWRARTPRGSVRRCAERRCRECSVLERRCSARSR
jgi:hypothetical protein